MTRDRIIIVADPSPDPVLRGIRAALTNVHRTVAEPRMRPWWMSSSSPISLAISRMLDEQQRQRDHALIEIIDVARGRRRHILER